MTDFQASLRFFHMTLFLYELNINEKSKHILLFSNFFQFYKKIIL